MSISERVRHLAEDFRCYMLDDLGVLGWRSFDAYHLYTVRFGIPS
jgi:hypothetical protein